MAHEVRARINTTVVAHKDLEIAVKSNGSKLGTLLISKGNIEWWPKGRYVNKKRLSWQVRRLDRDKGQGGQSEKVGRCRPRDCL